MFSITVKVDPKIQKEIDRLSRQLPRELGAALYAETVEIMRAALQRTPEANGTLHSSAYVTAPTPQGQVEAGYGAPYAPIIHERTDIHHSKGEAKFLQRAVDTASSGLLARLADRMKPAVEGKGGGGGGGQPFPTTPPGGGRSRSRRSKARRSLRR